MKDRYFSVKQRGYISVEFTPFVISQQDPSRKIFSLPQQRSAILSPESVHDYISSRSLIVESRKEKESQVVRLEAKEQAPGWEWKIEVLGERSDVRKVQIKPSDHFYLQTLFNSSIPYIYGWYALGDCSMADQGLAAEIETKDPFEHI